MNLIMSAARLGTILMLALGFFACSPTATTLIKYEKNGVSFTHLSDWKVTNDAVNEASAAVRSIALEGPNDAIVLITIVPASSAMTLKEYADDIAQERTVEIKQALSVGAISPAKVTSTVSTETTAQVGGTSRKGVMQTFSVELLGEQMEHVATFFMVSDQDRKAYIHTQAASEDYARVAPGFHATLDTFRLHTPK